MISLRSVFWLLVLAVFALISIAYVSAQSIPRRSPTAGVGACGPGQVLSIAAGKGLTCVDLPSSDLAIPDCPGTNSFLVGDAGGLTCRSAVIRRYWRLESGNLTSNNSVYAPGFFYSSDAEQKEHIVPLEDSLERIQQLQGYSFDFKEEFGGGSSIGFMAQEVEPVFPALVTEGGEDGYKSIAYAALIPVLVEALKEQQAQITELQETVEELRAQ